MIKILRILSFIVILISYQFVIAQSITITEIQYHADSSLQSQDWVEIHNAGATSVDISGWELKDESASNSYTIPGGTTLSADAYLVLAQRLDTFLMIYPTVTNVIGPFEFGLDNTAGSVRLYNAGGSLIKSISYIDSLPWPNGADGLGPTLQILDEEAEEDNYENWIAGCVGGSPGTEYTACDYDILVSEINYHSADDFDMKNWIELWNHSNASINISGWQFRDSNSDNIYTIPSGTTLNADARIVISDSLEAMSVLFPYLTNIIGEFTFGLSNSGDAIRLYNAAHILQYSVRFNDKNPWPEDADGGGFTIELNVENGNPNIASTWIAGCPHGSPGTELILPCGSAVENITTTYSIQILPNPFSESILISDNENFANEIQISTIFGEVILQNNFTNKFIWNSKEYPSGVYLISLISKEGFMHTEQVIKL